jgi:hypothetical protein
LDVGLATLDFLTVSVCVVPVVKFDACGNVIEAFCRDYFVEPDAHPFVYVMRQKRTLVYEAKE